MSLIPNPLDHGLAAPAATITLVADKALIPVSKLLGQRGEDPPAIAGVFAPLLLVEADNVATILNFDFYELQRGRILGPFALGGDFDPGRIAFEHNLGDLFGAAHAHPDDVMDRRVHTGSRPALCKH
jgi:hypothetical protein